MKARVMTRLLQGLAMLMLTGMVSAQDSGITWNDLNADQQRVLNSFAENWEGLEPERQKRLAMG